MQNFDGISHRGSCEYFGFNCRHLVFSLSFSVFIYRNIIHGGNQVKLMVLTQIQKKYRFYTGLN